MSDSIQHEELLRVAPSALEVDPVRPVEWREIDEALVESVAEVGLVQFPLVREHENALVVLDGTRRVQAAEEAGLDLIHVIRVEGGDAAALAAWCSLHVEAFDKSVNSSDREASLRELVNGPSHSVRNWETGEDIEEAAYRLGLRTDADRIADATDTVEGIGDATAERLADAFGDLESLRNASRRELTTVEGIGDRLAARLSENFSGDQEVTAVAQ